MKTSKKIMSKMDAKEQILKFGIIVSLYNISVGRFFLRKKHEKTGLGVCFVVDYHGIITRFAFLNFILSRIWLPELCKKDYCVYVRAFSGSHTRLADYEIMEKTDFMSYDAPNITFMAGGGEWMLNQAYHQIVPYNKQEVYGLKAFLDIKSKKSA